MCLFVCVCVCVCVCVYAWCTKLFFSSVIKNLLCIVVVYCPLLSIKWGERHENVVVLTGLK